MFFFISWKVEFDKRRARKATSSKRHLVLLNRAFIDYFYYQLFCHGAVHPLKTLSTIPNSSVILARLAFGWACPIHPQILYDLMLGTVWLLRFKSKGILQCWLSEDQELIWHCKALEYHLPCSLWARQESANALSLLSLSWIMSCWG